MCLYTPEKGMEEHSSKYVGPKVLTISMSKSFPVLLLRTLWAGLLCSASVIILLICLSKLFTKLFTNKKEQKKDLLETQNDS